jgi:hypothetical protein
MTPDLRGIVERLEEVEKQIAHLAAIVTEHADTDRTVVARQFVVRDERGQRRIELGTVIPEGQIEESPWLGLFDANENLRACIGVGGRGKHGPLEGPWIELYDGLGNVAAEIRVDENRPAIRFFNENGKTTVAVGTSELGPSVALVNPNGKESLTLSISLSGQPWMVMEDANGDKVLKLAVDSNGPCLLFGKDNKVFWSAS